MSFFTTKDGCNIYYEERGTGPNLLFVHGWSCNHHFFDLQAEYFSASYHVITYDFRGHGQSDRGEITERNMNLNRFGEDLFELITHLKLEKTHLVGWSMGMSAILSYVRLHGCHAIDRLCLIDMTPKLLNDETWQLGQGCDFTHEMNLKFLAQIATNWHRAVRTFVPNILARDCPKEADVYQWTMQQILENTPHVMLSMWIAMSNEDYRAVVPQITVPTLLAYGDDGFEYFQAHGEWMKAHVGGAAKLVMFPGCGHTLFREDPEGFNRALEIFLQEDDMIPE
jgi:pimeloyl-ACP methyl ester carboxylesterase